MWLSVDKIDVTEIAKCRVCFKLDFPFKLLVIQCISVFFTADIETIHRRIFTGLINAIKAVVGTLFLPSLGKDSIKYLYIL